MSQPVLSLSIQSVLVLAVVGALTLSAVASAGPSSGGYSRPAPMGYSRTPSTSGYSMGGGSGGYRRPSTATPPVASPSPRGGSLDQSISRRASKEALDRFRSGRAGAAESPPWPGGSDTGAAPRYRRPSTPDVDTAGRDGGWGGAFPPTPRRPSTNSDWGESMLGGVIGGVLGELSRGSHDRRWQDNSWGLPPRVSPAPPSGELPEPLPPESRPRGDSTSWSGWLTGFVVVGAILFLIVMARRAIAGVRIPARPPGGRADAASGGTARPRWLSLQRPLALDASPFILAASHVAIESPVSPTGSGMVTLEAVGEAVSGGVTWHRGYVAGGRSFLQIHEDAQGRLDECRYFSRLDEIIPADEGEWAFWLDSAEGMIGWPEFQTKDGKTYQRLWEPGQGRVAPREIEETLETVAGPRRSRQQAMLYARATGVAAPAPQAEYLLVAATEQDDSASVTLHLGIDLDPTGLQLP